MIGTEKIASPTRAEMRLAKAVFLQAFFDIITERDTYEKIEAEAWLTSRSAGLIFWCDIAGYHPDYIKKKALAVKGKGQGVFRCLPETHKEYLKRKMYRVRQND